MQAELRSDGRAVLPSLLSTLSREIDDPAQVAQASPGWQQEHIITQAGVYRMRILGVQTRRVQLAQTQVSLGRIIRGAIPRGAVSFAVPIWTLGEFTCRGTTLDGLAVAMESHNAEIDLRYEGMTKQIVLSVDEALLRDSARHLWQRDSTISELRFASASAREAFLSLALAELAPRASQTGRRADVFERRIVDQLLIQSAPEAELAGAARRRRAALRARRYICEHATERLSLSDMCRAAQTGYRTLQYAFLETFGFSPAEFARRERLLLVRRALEIDDFASVTDAAVHYGFDHLGRFAGAYARMFGERPSETLQGARSGTRGRRRKMTL